MLENKFDIFINNLTNTVWGVPFTAVLLSSGIFFTIYFGLPQIAMFYHTIRVIVGKYVRPRDMQGISNFKAFCIAISTPIGLGSVAGVAIALTTGGPGSIFWMWIAAFLGMSIKFASISLTMLYSSIEKETSAQQIGPMYIIKNGLPKNFLFLAFIFSALTILGSFSTGNIFQTNQIAEVLTYTFNIPFEFASIIIFTVACSVIVFERHRIISFVGKIAPFMVFLYAIGTIIIIFANFRLIDNFFKEIFYYAFNSQSIIGGTIGIALKEVITIGVRRAFFANEAGMGSMAMESRKIGTPPVQNGLVAMLGPLIDTIVICTMTAFIIYSQLGWPSLEKMHGVELTLMSFEKYYGPIGKYSMAFFVTLFAFSTIISWSYYGERGVLFLFGKKFLKFYRVLFVAALTAGSFVHIKTIIGITDPIIGLMAVPNLIAIIYLSPELKQAYKKYRRDVRAERI